jgi:hypothetical protein
MAEIIGIDEIKPVVYECPVHGEVDSILMFQLKPKKEFSRLEVNESEEDYENTFFCSYCWRTFFSTFLPEVKRKTE